MFLVKALAFSFIRYYDQETLIAKLIKIKISSLFLFSPLFILNTAVTSSRVQ